MELNMKQPAAVNLRKPVKRNPIKEGEVRNAVNFKRYAGPMVPDPNGDAIVMEVVIVQEQQAVDVDGKLVILKRTEQAMPGMSLVKAREALEEQKTTTMAKHAEVIEKQTDELAEIDEQILKIEDLINNPRRPLI